MSYVRFALTNFWDEADREMAQMTDLPARIDRFYEQRGVQAMSPEEAKRKVKEELRKNAALMVARKKAAEFANSLLNQEPIRAENPEKLVTERSLTVKVTAPFDRESGPPELDVPPDFTRAAFGLTDEQPIAGPIIGQNEVYIIALQRSIPSEIPSLESIRDKVMADYRFSQALQLARQAGVSFYATLTNGLAQGKSFSAVCLEANIDPMDLPPFSLHILPNYHAPGGITLSGMEEALTQLGARQCSALRITLDGGLILYVKSRLPADEVKMKAELPAFVAALRQERQAAAFNTWLKSEMEKIPKTKPEN